MSAARDAEATRAAIMDAAEKIFLEKGYGNTPLSEVAHGAGVTKSLIHHHFGSKEQLWDQVKLRRFSRYVEMQMAMLRDAPPTSELLMDSLAAYFRFLQENPQMVRMLAWMYIEQDMSPECARLGKELVDAAVVKLKEGQENGQLRRDMDPRFILTVFIALTQHWFQQREHLKLEMGWDIPNEELDELYLADMMKIFFGGISPSVSTQ